MDVIQAAAPIITWPSGGAVHDEQSFDYFPVIDGRHDKLMTPLKAVDPNTG